MSIKDLPWSDAPPQARPVREVLAALLRALGAVLDGLAMRLVRVEPEPVTSSETMFEFHAEAGAPEGALYVNGRLVGHLEGVTRL